MDTHSQRESGFSIKPQFCTFNLQEAATYLGCHVQTVRDLAARGELPGVKVGRAWRFIEVDLISYMRSKYTTPSETTPNIGLRSIGEWHSTKEMVSGGSISANTEDEYVKALGLK